MGFVSDAATGVFVWTGDPDRQAGHDWLLQWLTVHAQPFLPPLPAGLNRRMQGNLAETLSTCIAIDFRRPAARVFPMNAHKPLPKASICRFEQPS